MCEGTNILIVLHPSIKNLSCNKKSGSCVSWLWNVNPPRVFLRDGKGCTSALCVESRINRHSTRVCKLFIVVVGLVLDLTDVDYDEEV
jgi:hypothetical protein